MKIRLLYFARLRESLGIAQEQPDLPPEVRTVADLLAWLRGRGDVWAEQLAEGRPYRLAVNQDIAGADAILGEDDEVALFPPVTGG
jgi:molybdopterin synthase sulfur carrier subunit